MGYEMYVSPLEVSVSRMGWQEAGSFVPARTPDAQLGRHRSHPVRKLYVSWPHGGGGSAGAPLTRCQVTRDCVAPITALAFPSDRKAGAVGPKVGEDSRSSAKEWRKARPSPTLWGSSEVCLISGSVNRRLQDVGVMGTRNDLNPVA